jgi:hypothetical protein
MVERKSQPVNAHLGLRAGQFKRSFLRASKDGDGMDPKWRQHPTREGDDAPAWPENEDERDRDYYDYEMERALVAPLEDDGVCSLEGALGHGRRMLQRAVSAARLGDVAPSTLSAAVEAGQKEEDQRRHAAAWPEYTSGDLAVALKRRFQDAEGLPAAELFQVDDRDLERLADFVSRAGGGMVGALMLFLAPFWIRLPRHWSEPKGSVEQKFADLASYLFARSPVPGCLRNVWEDFRYRDETKWICWFILIGQDAGLRRAAPLFGWHIPDG